jgi:hypothetical protein
MGLYFQRHQEAKGGQKRRVTRQERCYYDSAIYGFICAPFNPNLSQVMPYLVHDDKHSLYFRRKVAAMGGMSAQIPIKNDLQANEVAMEKVRADKLREVTAGHDGTWIAHPLINQIARKVFDENMLGPNQVRTAVLFHLFLLLTHRL